MISELEAADIEAILAPIPGDQATGVDLRQDYSPTSLYFRLRDARAEARDAERRADGDGSVEGVATLWRPVATLAIDALKTSTKDLEVATWLTEALVRIAGLSGLTVGASIIAGLVEQHWDGLYPMPDESGLETRVAAVAGLSGQGADGTLMQPLRKTPLFSRPDGTPFGLWQYQATLDLSGITDPERREQRIAAGVVPFDDFENEARAAGRAHWQALRDAIVQTADAWEKMGLQLDEKAGDASPSGNRVRDALQLMLEVCGRFVPAAAEPAADQEQAPADGQSSGPAAGTMATGPIAGREQALRQLEEISAWFKQNEPNSPLGYTLEEAARRGRMLWPELVAELIQDDATRGALLVSVGMKRPDTAQ
ncbi:type VI secretion system protein TssA [Reyranella massiliensis]|uniref:type VI secretion system protein TssA n=1 Tax=Reyranella massiliensis TaxID=445220 RepID=UPI0002F710A8|nr:type VI secretion system protein TssA [Reyranella massiliensis]